MKLKAYDKSDVLKVFEDVDQFLKKKSEKLNIRILGGASILLLGVRERTTIDIDIAGTNDAIKFQKLCSKLGVVVDIVTVVTTVDLQHCPTVSVYKGDALAVDSVTSEDLIKLKLERFYKQDPEDIYAVIGHEKISFEKFKSLVINMLPDYIGNKREVFISAQIVVEQIWPDRINEFSKIKNDIFLL